MFRDQLKDIVEQTTGAWAGVLMGFDGIAVEQYTAPDAAIDAIAVGMELSFVLHSLRKSLDTLALGTFHELTMHTSTAQVLIRVLNKDYFLLVILDPQGLTGKGRYVLRTHSPALQQAL